MLAQAGHAINPSGEHLMYVALVAHIPYNLVLRQVVNVVQCQGKLHHAQVGCQVTAGPGYRVNQEFPDLLR